MAEIGAIASIVGVAGAGAKLSIILFEFASTVGSAGVEVKRIGIEISLFCSVLKQLQSTLAKAKAYRYSLSALQTTQEILDRCQEVLKAIEGIVESLQKRSGGEVSEPSLDLIARVKWTFKRSQVQVLRTTLESCKITLHIMLTTLEFAQKIATRRTSTVEMQAEDEHAQTMTHSLIIAHQCTVETLKKLEAEEGLPSFLETGDASPPLTPVIPPVARVLGLPARHKPSPAFGSQKSLPSLPSRDVDRERASVWINDLIFENRSLPPGFRRHTWGDVDCTEFLEEQQHYFLRKWTDQGRSLDEVDEDEFKESPNQSLPAILRDTEASKGMSTIFSGHLTSLSIFVDRLQQRMVDSDHNDEADKIYSLTDLSDFEYSLAVRNGRDEFAKSIKTFTISLIDPCYKILPFALKQYNIKDAWENYALCIVYDRKMRYLGTNERPLQIFRELEKEGIKPTLALRKFKTSSPESALCI